MTAYLQKILDDCAAVDLARVKPPVSKAPKDCHVVGSMSEGLRRMWGVVDTTRGRVNETIDAQNKFIHDYKDKITPARTAKLTEMSRALERQKESYEFLEELFWNSIKHEFPVLKDKVGNIGVYHGWEIGWMEEDCVRCSPAMITLILNNPFADLADVLDPH